jgi:hypothetical protein
LTSGDGTPATGWQIDARHFLAFDPRDQAEVRDVQDVLVKPGPRIDSRPGWASLAALGGGVVIFCSGVAAACLVEAAPRLTRLAVPLMLVGLFCLAVGVLCQLHRIRRESRAALDRMRLLDLRLQEYRYAAMLVGPASDIPSSRAWPGQSRLVSRFAS